MESGTMAYSGTGAHAPTERSSPVMGRWLLLLTALVVPFAAAFAFGLARKSKGSTPALALRLRVLWRCLRPVPR